MKASHKTAARKAVREAASYLRDCGLDLPSFRLTTGTDEGSRFGGSTVEGDGAGLTLNMGHYPFEFQQRWFAMHELGHILWAHHHPLRWKRFRAQFGDPAPNDYESIHKHNAYKTAGSFGKLRPKGQPSYYGARAGGEERFCELLGLMWSHGDFYMDSPHDLEALWNTCWYNGLSRMT